MSFQSGTSHLQQCNMYVLRLRNYPVEIFANKNNNNNMDHDRNIFLILDHFLPFYPLTAKNENITHTKNKQTLGDIIILHKCTKNHVHPAPTSAHNIFSSCKVNGAIMPVFFPLQYLHFQKSYYKLLIRVNI